MVPTQKVAIASHVNGIRLLLLGLGFNGHSVFDPMALSDHPLFLILASACRELSLACSAHGRALSSSHRHLLVSHLACAGSCFVGEQHCVLQQMKEAVLSVCVYCCHRATTDAGRA
ncbi:hypothetical protein HETIRDRAFT_166748 [Heterobasidion irregulare TC 32-1]|uniref:Uncharacterized protein n=1 Tax=Heterobasidion irregulare (strain TC 32-1) TaxID=747525 RepID=W4KN20_HETIT|nr:uncharacterized protein HETIRDRAFT_166748 [Heterobasidion irregulare TC 32-1]ETW87212.1 hypothetical protein HETIRDRAFT_166748 [Heterobasidion irregulare TC 32-1]